MTDSKFNLSRLIIIIILLMQVCHLTNAQTNPEPPESSYGLYTGFNPSVAIIIIFIICAFFLVGFASLYIRQCSESPATATPPVTSGDQSKRRSGLNPAVINTFPIFLYSSVKEIKIGRGALECAICLSEFEDDDTLRLIKCDHVFHPDCIDAWLGSHVTCPVCRANQQMKTTIKSSEKKVNEPNTESTTQDSENEIVINVNEEDNDEEEQPQQLQQNRARITEGKFPRSNSTGHSMERYTLRLPEEIRKEMIVNTNSLKRTMSFNVVLAKEEGSSRGRSSRFDRWVFSMTAPFVSKVGSVDKTGDVSNNNRTLLTAVKVPLNCLNAKVEESPV